MNDQPGRADRAGAGDLVARIARVRARIAAAAARADRDPATITLVAVSKTVEIGLIRAAIDAGMTDLGENRAQELRRKQESLADRDVRWHMIGSLQRNKVKDVVGRVVLIHSVDSFALADAIAARARGLEITQDILLEVNASGEQTKHGIAPSDVAIIAQRVAGLKGVRLRGFMTLAAPGDLEVARSCFRTLRTIRDEIAATIGTAAELSMGMTGDLDAAVEEGATIVRVGTAIFGVRSSP